MGGWCHGAESGNSDNDSEGDGYPGAPESHAADAPFLHAERVHPCRAGGRAGGEGGCAGDLTD
ncbi:hypothetical protein GCM10023205_30330 [Yinghuangia aomiensis]|uniref:Uncharacterized protein n=1 Tax=Yinghuangia aomiensis TaxID=676205 RepID=A0ABP9H8V2_9ACTN